MDSIYWLMSANVAVWLGIGAYIFFLGRVQKNIEQRLHLKEALENE